MCHNAHECFVIGDSVANDPERRLSESFSDTFPPPFPLETSFEYFACLVSFQLTSSFCQILSQFFHFHMLAFRLARDSSVFVCRGERLLSSQVIKRSFKSLLSSPVIKALLESPGLILSLNEARIKSNLL